MAAKQQQLAPPQREMPFFLEAEMCVLGALMMRNELLYAVSAFLEPEHFYEPLHRSVYGAIQDLILRGAEAKPWNVRGQIPEQGSVGDMTIAQYLAHLAGEAIAPMELPGQAMAIVDAYNRRRLISVGEMLTEAGYGEGNPKVLSEKGSDAQSVLGDVIVSLEGKIDMGGSQLAEAYLDSITTKPGTKGRKGVPLPLPEIGTVISEQAFEAGNLYGLLSSSGEGKTSLTLQIIYDALAGGHPVQFFSFDQTGTQVVAQMVAQHLGYEVRHQKAGDLTDKQVDQAYAFARKVGDMPFEVVDCDSTKDTVSRMTAFAKRFVKRKGNGKAPLFVFDHMSAIPPEYEYRGSDEGTKALTKGNALKSLAKNLKAVCLVLQQRSGAGMKRFNPRPIPADLYGGEGARQPFDAIFYLFRAEEHLRKQLDTAKDEKEEGDITARFSRLFPREVGIEGTAEIGTLKVRFGKAGIKRHVRFIPEYTRYETMYRMLDEGQETML